MRSTMILCVLLLSGCVTEKAVLVNSDGKVVRCEHSGWGWVGAPVAMHEQTKCVKAAKEAGYVEPL